MHHSRRLAFCALAAGLLSASLVRAEDAPKPKQKWVEVCDADMKKFCKADLDKNSDVRPCLAAHGEEISEGCQAGFLRQYRIVESCKDDIEKVCKEEAAAGKLGQCFNDKQAQLSAGCKSALSKATKARAAEKKAEASEKPADPKAATAAAPAKDAARPAPPARRRPPRRSNRPRGRPRAV